MTQTNLHTAETPGRARHRTWPYIILLLIAPALLFWQLWWPFDHATYGFEYGDFTEQHVAMRTFVTSQLRAGHLPLWDPYTFAGEPAVADPLFSTFYLPSLWQVLFPPRWMYWVLQADALLHAALLGIFTFLFVRRLTHNARAGLVAGLAFSLSGYVTSYPMLQVIILQAITWLPAILWAVDIAIEENSRRHLLLVGVFLSFAILSGYAQSTMYVVYLMAAYILWKGWQRRLSLPRLVFTGVIPLLVALTLSAPQWIASLQMLPLSPRGRLTWEEISNGFQAWELWGLLRPNADTWSPLYVGLIPLALAVLAALLDRGRKTAFWWGVAIVALLLSMGRYGPLYPLLAPWWPGLTTFREQERWALLTVFSLAVLAGIGYAYTAQRWSRVRRLFWGIILLLFLDLFRANSGVILQPVPPSGPFVETPIVQQVRSVSPPHWRMSSEGLLPGGANAGLVFHIRDVVGSGPLYLAALDDFVNTVPELRWWQMLNIRHVLTRRELSHGGLLHVMDEGDHHLYQTFIGAHSAWIVHEAEQVQSQSEAITRTASPTLDPFRRAVLETTPDPRPRPPTGKEELQLTAFSARQVRLHAVLTSPGIVVSSEVFYPGWEVRVNGRPARPLRAYGLLRAVALPAGTWDVEWRFRPWPIYAGLGVSLAGWVIVVALMWRNVRPRAHPPG